jgi:hypothetical protein
VGFFWDKLKEVPNRLINKWREDRIAQGSLPFDDLIEMAGLSDPQLDSQFVAQGLKHCAGLAEWGLVTADTGGWREFYLFRRSVLHALAGVVGSARRHILSPEGLQFNDLPAAAQQEIFRGGEHIFGVQQLIGCRLKLEYAQPGRYVWHAPGHLYASGDAEARIPLIQGKTAEEALEGARKIDPMAEASDIHKSQGMLAVSFAPAMVKDFNWSFAKPMPSR